ncbi:preprotein translocase subunit YajC [Gallaecimonas pentaromativorans]|uniref:Sec translocon accessory complex subunit YajC n=1 Tax=Gallaecimonas pentaromativorans TaxID=584787 RepID=A0A3N1PJ89_9GAMM|nr:preprotein translocase subunit YajC [Gallaecimonas pentaromativorans]MED5524674.1 preprotein translocase subunit YajC [Pseudomonadota bacterium]ROQ28663.1 protein translocase subunit yajC [Gallaecimonas pentaromativorans]
MFINSAFASTGAAGQQGGGLQLIIMLVLFGAIFYFMIYRPQAKRVKEHKNLMGNLKKGDEVLTNGGLIGRIAKVEDDKDFLVIALNDTTEVTVQKAAVQAVLPKGTMKSL